MINPLSVQLTTQFYEWERRGRGWDVWDCSVELEPPFETFAFRSPAPQRHTLDDGRKHTFLSSFIESFKTGKAPQSSAEEFPIDSATTAEPIPFHDHFPIHEVVVSLPSGEVVKADTSEHLLLMLSLCQFPISFELVGTKSEIKIQFACREPDMPHLKQQLQIMFPSSTILQSQIPLTQLCVNKALETAVIDFGLSEEFMRPLKVFNYFDPDPLLGAIGALEDLQTGEVGIVQVLFQTTRQPWARSILGSVIDAQGGSFFADASDMVVMAREKTSRPLFTVVLRVVGSADSNDRAWNIAKSLAGFPTVLSLPHINELIPLTNEGYDDHDHFQDVIHRQSHRCGMLLNSEELVSVVHLPSVSVQSAKLHHTIRKTKLAPAMSGGADYILGENVHRTERTVVSLTPEQRLKHVYVIGATGTGKSTLLLNLITQGLEHGEGLAVIDPHGDLCDEVIDRVPERRLNDVVLFDPSDTERCIGLNLLSARSETEKNVLTSDLVASFRRLSTSWGDQMTSVLGNAIQAFLESSQGGTLLELRRFLLEEPYRKSFLKTVTDPEVSYFWDYQFPLLRGNTQASILTRLDTFLRPKVVRNVVSQKDGLDFETIMNQKKVLLVKLAQGFIGEENSSLLGSLLVSKLHQAAMARQTQRSTGRQPFFLYLDEFQNFITPSIAGILSGARKYHLGLVLAHQELRQLWNENVEIANSVISNPGTRICFRLGDFDAQKLQDGFSFFKAQDLMNLGVGEAVARIERADHDFNLKTFPQKRVEVDVAEARQNAITQRSQALHKHVKGQPESVPPVVRTETPVPLPAMTRDQATKIEPKPILPPPDSMPMVEIDDNGLSQHRYLQTLIKRMAEDRGYRSVIEEPIPNGGGRVDVGLLRDGERIACEISVTTSDEHELQNIRKCLAAGYAKIIMCATEKKRLDKIQALTAEQLEIGDHQRILFLQPDGLFSYLEERAPTAAITGERIKGYRVKIQYDAVKESEQKEKRNAVAQVILQSMRRMKEK